MDGSHHIQCRLILLLDQCSVSWLNTESGTIITSVIFTTKEDDYWKEKKKPTFFFFLIIRLFFKSCFCHEIKE